VFHADRIKSPVLIFQASRDPRVNIAELRQFVGELRKRNVPVTYKPRTNERGTFKGQNRIEMYKDIEHFLAVNMKVKQ
jgi:dipeptidyl aminopeptidase/acylaminoacyl peptidase